MDDSENEFKKLAPPNVIDLLQTSENEKSKFIEKILIFFSIVLCILTFPFSLCFCVKVVSEYQRAVIFRMGRLRKGGARGPGVFFILPCVDFCIITDLRTISLDVNPQEVITIDAVSIKVDAVVFLRLYDPLRAVIQVQNYTRATKLLAQTTLRSLCGKKDLSDLLSNKQAISMEMYTHLRDATNRWGILVERVEIKDIQLPSSLQRALAAEAEASRDARAKIISAEGERDAAQALREASDVMSTNPTALQLRYLQTLCTVAAEKNETIIFPFPVEIFDKLLK